MFSDWRSITRGPLGVLLGVALTSCVLAGGVGAQMASNDPIVGVWQLNVERSVYSPGPRPPADLVTIYEFAPLDDGSIRFTLTSTNAQGAPTFQLSAFKVDGQQRPVHNANTLGAYMASGQQTNLTRSYRRIDARSTEFTTYNDGVAGIPTVRTVSPDGQTYINIVRGTNAQGLAINNVTIFDRVR
jgi:hypothetical protein